MAPGSPSPQAADDAVDDTNLTWKALAIDPELLGPAHALPDSPYDLAYSDNPPSPVDVFMIDPELLALYTGSDPSLPPALYPGSDPSPPLEAAAARELASNNTTQTTASADGAPALAPNAVTATSSSAADKNGDDQKNGYTQRAQHARASGRKRRPRPADSVSLPAVGKAKRTRSDGVLVPPAPCTRCISLDLQDECRVIYDGAACNTCRRRGRKCSLVDRDVTYSMKLGTGRKKAVGE